MNEHLCAEHHLIILDTGELADALYDAVDARDLPGMADVDSSLLLFCREIKKHATVALSGECADEFSAVTPVSRQGNTRRGTVFPGRSPPPTARAFFVPNLPIGSTRLPMSTNATERTLAEKTCF